MQTITVVMGRKRWVLVGDADAATSQATQPPGAARATRPRQPPARGSAPLAYPGFFRLAPDKG